MKKKNKLPRSKKWHNMWVKIGQKTAHYVNESVRVTVKCDKTKWDKKKGWNHHTEQMTKIIHPSPN